MMQPTNESEAEIDVAKLRRGRSPYRFERNYIGDDERSGQDDRRQ